MVGTASGIIALNALGFTATPILAALCGAIAVGSYIAFIVLVLEPREPGRGYSPPPPPPFKASKKTAIIMNGLWYGRITPNQARMKALRWGFDEASVERMIADSTAEPSFWWWHEQFRKLETMTKAEQ
jgi:hypothetical protein